MNKKIFVLLLISLGVINTFSVSKKVAEYCLAIQKQVQHKKKLQQNLEKMFLDKAVTQERRIDLQREYSRLQEHITRIPEAIIKQEEANLLALKQELQGRMSKAEKVVFSWEARDFDDVAKQDMAKELRMILKAWSNSIKGMTDASLCIGKINDVLGCGERYTKMNSRNHSNDENPKFVTFEKLRKPASFSGGFFLRAYANFVNFFFKKS